MSSLSNDFTLTFNGFNNESPDARRDFQNLCATNLDLSAEEATSIISAPGENILCRKSSAAEITRLADHFRAIGARVNIAGPATHLSAYDTSAETGPFSEVDRVFTSLTEAQQQPSQCNLYSSTEAHSATHPVVSHFSPRTRGKTPHVRAQNVRSSNTGERLMGILAACGIGSLLLAAGVANLLSAGAVRDSSSHVPSAYLARQKLEHAAHVALNAPAETLNWSGTTTRPDQGYKIQLSALQVADVISARFMIADTSEKMPLSAAVSEVRLRHVESDPGVLRKVAPERWKGDLPVYIFLTHGEKKLRVLGLAHVIVSGGASLSARVSVIHPHNNPEVEAPQDGLSASQAAEGDYRFSLVDTVVLTR
jgi:hypothetical protein